MVGRQGAPDISVNSTRQCDEALRRFFREPRALDERHTLSLPLQVRTGHKSVQVSVTSKILYQHNQLKRAILFVLAGNL